MYETIPGPASFCIISYDSWVCGDAGHGLAQAVELSQFKLGDSVRQKSTGEEGVILDLDPVKGWLTDIGGGRYVKEADLALTAFVVGEAGALELCVTPCGDDTLAAMLPAVKAEIKVPPHSCSSPPVPAAAAAVPREYPLSTP